MKLETCSESCLFTMIVSLLCMRQHALMDASQCQFKEVSRGGTWSPLPMWPPAQPAGRTPPWMFGPPTNRDCYRFRFISIIARRLKITRACNNMIWILNLKWCSNSCSTLKPVRSVRTICHHWRQRLKYFGTRTYEWREGTVKVGCGERVLLRCVRVKCPVPTMSNNK